MTLLSDSIERIGGFSNPAKMPSLGWSIPAPTCQLGALLAKRSGTTCSECYALKGRYMMPNVISAMERRYDILTEALRDEVASDVFVCSFAFILNTRRGRFDSDRFDATPAAERRGWNDARRFRWHDSGDLQSAGHLDLIARIAALTPRVSHWLPTRQLNHVQAWLADCGSFPANLTVRVSAAKIDAPHPVKVTGQASGVHTTAQPAHGQACSAPSTGGFCDDCRACWHRSVPSVSYKLH